MFPLRAAVPRIFIPSAVSAGPCRLSACAKRGFGSISAQPPKNSAHGLADAVKFNDSITGSPSPPPRDLSPFPSPSSTTVNVAPSSSSAPGASNSPPSRPAPETFLPIPALAPFLSASGLSGLSYLYSDLLPSFIRLLSTAPSAASFLPDYTALVSDLSTRLPALSAVQRKTELHERIEKGSQWIQLLRRVHDARPTRSTRFYRSVIDKLETRIAEIRAHSTALLDAPFDPPSPAVQSTLRHWGFAFPTTHSLEEPITVHEKLDVNSAYFSRIAYAARLLCIFAHYAAHSYVADADTQPLLRCWSRLTRDSVWGSIIDEMFRTWCGTPEFDAAVHFADPEPATVMYYNLLRDYSLGIAIPRLQLSPFPMQRSDPLPLHRLRALLGNRGSSADAPLADVLNCKIAMVELAAFLQIVPPAVLRRRTKVWATLRRSALSGIERRARNSGKSARVYDTFRRSVYYTTLFSVLHEPFYPANQPLLAPYDLSFVSVSGANSIAQRVSFHLRFVFDAAVSYLDDFYHVHATVYQFLFAQTREFLARISKIKKQVQEKKRQAAEMTMAISKRDETGVTLATIEEQIQTLQSQSDELRSLVSSITAFIYSQEPLRISVPTDSVAVTDALYQTKMDEDWSVGPPVARNLLLIRKKIQLLIERVYFANSVIAKGRDYVRRWNHAASSPFTAASSSSDTTLASSPVSSPIAPLSFHSIWDLIRLTVSLVESFESVRCHLFDVSALMPYRFLGVVVCASSPQMQVLVDSLVALGNRHQLPSEVMQLIQNQPTAPTQSSRPATPVTTALTLRNANVLSAVVTGRPKLGDNGSAESASDSFAVTRRKARVFRARREAAGTDLDTTQKPTDHVPVADLATGFFEEDERLSTSAIAPTDFFYLDFGAFVIHFYPGMEAARGALPAVVGSLLEMTQTRDVIAEEMEMDEMGARQGELEQLRQQVDSEEAEVASNVRSVSIIRNYRSHKEFATNSAQHLNIMLNVVAPATNDLRGSAADSPKRTSSRQKKKRREPNAL